MIVYLDDKRRQLAMVIGKIQHAVAGFPLLFLGMDKVSAGEELPIAVAEIVIAVMVLASFALEVRSVVRHRKHGTAQSHPKVGWFDIAAGAMLIYEAIHGAHHKAFHLRPQFVAGLMTLLLGLLHHRLSRFAGKRRRFRIDENGVAYQVPFRSWSVAWDQLAAVDLTPSEAVFERVDGKRHVLDLARLHNHDAVRRAVIDHPAAAKLLRD